MADVLEDINTTYSANTDQEEWFNKFWKSWPSTNEHGMFPATRSFKVNKPKAKTEFIKVINEGHSPELIIKAILNDVKLKKRMSITTNELQFIKNPDRWLRDKEFLNYTEDSHEEKTRVNIR